MSLKNILMKGEYTHRQPEAPVRLRHYIIFRDEGKKKLLLDFDNSSKEKLDSITFNLCQYNIKGEFLCKESVRLEVGAAAESEFSPERSFVLRGDCEDFTVELNECKYGSFVYMPKGDGVQVVFEKRSGRVKRDRTKEFGQMRERTSSVMARTLHSPKFFIPMILVIALAVALFIGIRIELFSNTRESFTLGGVKYTFLTSDKSGPVEIEYYSGSGTVYIGDNIEGYKIAGIMSNAFLDSDVQEIIIDGNIEISDYAFRGAKQLTSVSISGVTAISQGAFMGCSSLKSVSLGDSVTSIDKRAFEECSSLASLTLPDSLVTIGDGAFGYCASLTKLEIPSSVTALGTNLVRGASKLESITLPFIGLDKDNPKKLSLVLGSVTQRKKLTEVKVTLDTAIGEEVFRDENYLKSITYESDVTSIGKYAFYGCSSLLGFTVGESVESIGEFAFAHCNSLKELAVEAELTEIPNGAFLDCISLESFEVSLSVKKIGEYAFSGCASLKSFSVPSNVSELGMGIFRGCSKLNTLSIYKMGSGVSLSYLYAGNPSAALAEFTLSDCQSIPEGGFSGFTGLIKVTLPQNLKTIGKQAFAECTNLAALDIPQSVTEIGSGAFSGCKALKETVVPAKVTAVQKNLFSGCTSLESVRLPAGITVIEEGAFLGCEKLVSMTIPSGVTSLGDSCFEGCKSLSAVDIPVGVTALSNRLFFGCASLAAFDIPSHVTDIGEYTFADCAALTSFTIPSTIEDIGKGAFSGCVALAEISVPFIGGKDGGTFSYIFDANVPATLRKVTVREEDTLAPNAFSGISSLETVDLSSCTITECGSNAFSGCVSLRNVSLPPSVKTFGTGLFSGCTSLTELILPPELTAIPANCFGGCTSLTSVTLTASVQSIYSGAFSGCTSLTSYTVPNTVNYIDRGAFSGCTSLSHLTVPFVGSSSSTESFNYIFDSNVPQSLKKVTVTSVTTLRSNAFGGCSNIETVELPSNLTSIGTGAFSGCSSLKNITLPQSLGKISSSAFSDCSSLASISIPESVTAIDSYAFLNCRSLTSLTVPDTVLSIGQSSFAGCSALAEISVPFVGASRSSTSRFYYIFGYGVASVPASLKSVTVTSDNNIPSYGFDGLSEIERVTLSSPSLTNIESFAFRDCSSLSFVSLPSGVTTVGTDAFSGCNKLYTVENKTSFNLYSAFSSSKISNALLRAAASESDIVTLEHEGFKMLLGDGEVWYVTDYTADADTNALSFPENFIYGSTVITSYSVAPYFAEDDDAITSVYLSASVAGVGKSAFAGCNGITALTASAASVLTSIGEYVFYNCSALEVVTLPTELSSIGQNAFYGTYSMRVVFNLSDLPVSLGSSDYGSVARYAETVLNETPSPMREITAGGFKFKNAGSAYILVGFASGSSSENINIDDITFEGSLIPSIIIGRSAFSYNYNVKSIHIGSQVSAIGSSAFAGCTGVTSLTFEEGVKTISSQAFYECRNITEADLPDSVESIGSFAFRYCRNLKEVTLPDGLVSIPEFCFESCLRLTTITLPGTLSSIGSSAFNGCYSLVEVINLSSSITVTAGSSNNGYVGYYAIKVRGAGDTPFTFTEVNSDVASFTFAKDGSSCYLLYADVTASVTDGLVMEIPELWVNEVNQTYEIYKYFFSVNTSVGSVTKMVIPNTVSAISPSVLGNFATVTVYYKGSEAQLEAVVPASTFAAVYYYNASGCIHAEGRWTYDANGEIITDITETTFTVITPSADCQTQGIGEEHCDKCGITSPVSLPVTDHSFSDEGECTVCGAERVLTVTSANFTETGFITNDTYHPFAISGEGIISSTNETVNSSSELRITATETITVSFSYLTSTEADYDKLIISLNGTKLSEFSGIMADYAPYSVDLKTDDVLTICYSKDSTRNYGDDTVYIKNLTITRK